MKADKKFENDCLDYFKWAERRDLATANRYGVQGSFIQHKQPCRACRKRGEWRPVESLPDIEGQVLDGPSFIFDCKHSSARTSLQLKGSTIGRQLSHMMKRSRFGSICFYLVHFTERETAQTFEAEATYAFPVSHSHPFWIAVEAGEITALQRTDCDTHAIRVRWGVPKGCRNERPLLLDAIEELEVMFRTQPWLKAAAW